MGKTGREDKKEKKAKDKKYKKHKKTKEQKEKKNEKEKKEKRRQLLENDAETTRHLLEAQRSNARAEAALALSWQRAAETSAAKELCLKEREDSRLRTERANTRRWHQWTPAEQDAWQRRSSEKRRWGPWGEGDD